MSRHIPPANSDTRSYPPLSVALHWLSALAVAIAFIVGWSRAALDEPHPRAVLMLVHQCAGMSVMVLLLARLGARLGTCRYTQATSLPPLVKWAASLSHSMLYALLLAMPLLGWALTNAHGRPVGLPGLPALPALVEPDPNLAETLESWHLGLAWVLGLMIVAHAGAALFHHFVWRDNVLHAMLPRAWPRAHRGRPQHDRPV